MLKKIFLTLVVSLASYGTTIAQTDSTDLNLYTTEAVLETELDTMLYGDDSYEQLNLDFTISDTVSFSKVHIELTDLGTGSTLFKKVYTLSDLETDSLISSWEISIPFGNLKNTETYRVAVIIEEYDGSLGTTLLKTL